MKYVLLSLMFLSLPALAEILHCKNSPTGAEFNVSQQRSHIEYTMNSTLADILQSQGSYGVVAEGGGQIDWGGGELFFFSGAAHGYSLDLKRDSGGMKLYYQSYGSGRSEFYFNPGECLVTE